MACLPWPTNHVKHTDLQLARKPQVAAHTPPAKLGQSDLQLARKPRVAAHTPARSRTTGPTACNEAAGGCPHTCEIRDNRTCNLQDTLTQNIRTNNLQVSRVWLPTRPLVSEFTARSFQAYNIQLVSSIAATRYLRGLPPGHTAASISLGGTYRQCNHGSVSVPPGSPSGSYSCEHLSSTHATYIH